MLEKWKAGRAEKRAKREAENARQRALKQQSENDRLRKVIDDELDLARTRLEAVRTFEGLTGADVPEQNTIVLKSGEKVFAVVTGAVLIEPKKGPGQWHGRNQGVSVPIPGTKLRYRVGASKGTFQQGEEKPTPIDEGTFVVTNTRAVFSGEKQTREWAWSKLVSVTHYDPGWTAMAVSNRQKISGVGVDPANVESMEFLLDLAIARASGDTSRIEADCADDVAQLEAKLAELAPAPVPPTAALPPSASTPPPTMPPPSSPPSTN